MKTTKRGAIAAFTAGLAFCGCDGDKGDDSGGPSDEPALAVSEIEFDLESDRLLSSLSDQEIRSACELMAGVIQEADEGVACQIVAATEDSEESCAAVRDSCLDNPGDALALTTVRATPAPINCEIFNSSLTSGCDFPVSLLESCANSLAQSVVPAAEAVKCSEATEIADLDAAEDRAAGNKGTDFVTVCLDLLACENLVSALLGGEDETGEGGAGGSPN